MTRTLRMWGVAAGLVMVVGWGVGQTSSWPPGPEHAVVKLWPKGVPGTATVAKGPEADTTTPASEKIAGRPLVRLGNVSVPTLMVYESKGTGNGAGVVVFPGGGYNILGFSAGGHLAAAVSTHYETRLYAKVDAADEMSCRPDFAVVVYPGELADPKKGMRFSADIPVTKDTPPTFLVQAEDDSAHVENAVSYFLALKGAGVPTELHVYAEGGHGYGLRRTKLPVTGWPDLVDEWMKTIGVTTGAQ